MNERIKELMKQADYPAPEIASSAQKLAELIAEACAQICMSQADRRNIRLMFGLPVESNVKYPGPEAQGHQSQYGREYNIPREGS